MTLIAVTDRRAQLRAWYRDSVRKLPRKVVADVTWLLDQLDVRDPMAQELTRLDTVCNGLAAHLNTQSEKITALTKERDEARKVLEMWVEYRFCCSDTPVKEKLDKMLHEVEDATLDLLGYKVRQ